MSRKEFRDLADPTTARDTISGLDISPGTETVSLADARDRVLVDRIDAERDVPGFDRASMDGYAVKARDTFGADEGSPIELELHGTVHAGEAPEVHVQPGTAVEISTGAVMPPEADAVVKVEDTDEQSAGIRVRRAVAPGDNVMHAGADIAAGTRALGPGTRLTPREIGLLSALGCETVTVRAKPLVGIVSTGDELVRPGSELDDERGQIYDVNSYTIATGVEEAGGEARLYPHTGDDLDALESMLTQAANECDLVLSSGSTSASAVDVIYRVIEDRGDLLLHGVAVKPGKPMLVGRLEDAAYIGLPGYPVSALTIFRTFVAPVLREAADLPASTTATIEASMAVRERYAEGRMRLLPVGLVTDAAGDVLAYPVDKGSGATTSLVEADGVIEVEDNTEYLATDEAVTVNLFSPDVRPPTLFGVGEDDPAFSRLLDRLDHPRYLSIGSRDGARRLRNGVPDIAVVSGPNERTLDGPELGRWQRDWGLLVPPGNPNDVSGIEDLIDRDLRFVNRDRPSGLRASLDARIDRLAEDHGVERHTYTDAISGYELTLNAHESPGRAVLAGKADVALGLRTTATTLDLEYIDLGTEAVRLLGNPDRQEKPGVQELVRELNQASDIFAEIPGYRR